MTVVWLTASLKLDKVGEFFVIRGSEFQSRIEEGKKE